MGPLYLEAADVLRLITRTILSRSTQRTGLDDAVMLTGQWLLRNLTLQIPQAFFQHQFIQNII